MGGCFPVRYRLCLFLMVLEKKCSKCAEPRVYINTYILIPGNTVMCVDTSDMYAKNTKICRIYPF